MVNGTASGLFERILIIGGAGQLGTELRRILAEYRPIAPPRRNLDLESPDSILTALSRHRPTLVLNAAAYHHVELCELHPERAFAVNAHGVNRLAAACALLGAALLTVSTDYVFDGRAGRAYREDDRPNPLSAYGTSKLAGKQLAARHGGRLFIARTSGLYGAGGSSVKGYTFIDKVLGQAERNEPVRVVNDVVFSPSYALDVAQSIVQILKAGRPGCYHVTNGGACTWYDFAREAFRLRGLSPDLEAVSYESFETVVDRPRYSALENTALAALGIAPPRHWREGLADYLRVRASCA